MLGRLGHQSRNSLVLLARAAAPHHHNGIAVSMQQSRPSLLGNFAGRRGDCLPLPIFGKYGRSSRCLSTTASTSSGADNDDNAGGTDTTTTASPNPPRQRRRRRHNFDLKEVPSFEAFQQQQQIRSLYRQFIRLAFSSSSRDDLLAQIRREFRQVMGGGGSGSNNGSDADNTTVDPWALKRALSDGGRRYKELSAMLSSVPGAKKTNDDDETTTGNTETDAENEFVNEKRQKSNTKSSAWPWQSGNPAPTGKPVAFPKR